MDNTITIKMLTLQLLADCPAEIQELFAEAQAAQEAANMKRYGQKDAPGPQRQPDNDQTAVESASSPNAAEPVKEDGSSKVDQPSPTEKRRFWDIFRRKPSAPPPTSHPDAELYHTLRVATFSSSFFHPNRRGEEQGGYVALEAPGWGYEYFLIKAVRRGPDGVWYHAGVFNGNRNDCVWTVPIRLEPTRFNRARVAGYLEHTGLSEAAQSLRP